MIDPTTEDIGRSVLYRDRAHPSEPDAGTITSFNETCVFVRYGSDVHSKGTRRRDLEWAKAKPTETMDKLLALVEKTNPELYRKLSEGNP